MDGEYTFALLPGSKAHFAFFSLGETRCWGGKALPLHFQGPQKGI